MALTRANLLVSVVGELTNELAVAGVAETDTTKAMKEPLDNTFRALNVAEAGLAGASAPDGDEDKAVAFVIYFGWARIVAALAGKMNVAASGARANLREQYQNAVAERDRALAIAQSTYGLRLLGALNAVPWAGGLSAAERAATESNLDRVKPFFERPADPANW